MKNLCSYCGRKSGTNAPFPKEWTNNKAWLLAMCPRCHSLEHIKLLDYPRSNDDEFQENLIAQNKSDKKRKMVGNRYVDLVFWFDDDDSIYGFQFTLRKNEYAESAFTWSRDLEGNIRQIFMQRRQFEMNTLRGESDIKIEVFIDAFEKGSRNLNKYYRSFVQEKLEQYRQSGS